MTAKTTFRQSDLERALKAAKADETVVAVLIDGDVITYERGETPPRQPYRGPAVYFVRIDGFDLVKIGYSTDVRRRILGLEAGAGMGGALKELRRIPGDVHLERSFHARFADQRLFGEWFRLSGPIEAWLAE